MGGRERCRRLFVSQLPQFGPEETELLLDIQMARPSFTAVVCDLCDAQLPSRAPVYTCGNGDHTVLHPTTYDVCEGCFV